MGPRSTASSKSSSRAPARLDRPDRQPQRWCDVLRRRGPEDPVGPLPRHLHGRPSRPPRSSRPRCRREARTLRHQLEAFHGRRDPKAVDAAWPHLGSPDRFIRWAARVAIEHQAPETWRDRPWPRRIRKPPSPPSWHSPAPARSTRSTASRTIPSPTPHSRGGSSSRSAG